MSKRAQAKVDAFNALYPIETEVTFWSGVREGEGTPSKTRSKAFLLSGHTPVVCVEGDLSCVALTHVEPTGGTCEDFAERCDAIESAYKDPDGDPNALRHAMDHEQ